MTKAKVVSKESSPKVAKKGKKDCGEVHEDGKPSFVNYEIESKKQNMILVDKIVYAIQSLNDGPNGSSRQAINDFLRTRFKYDRRNLIQRAIQQGLKKKLFVRVGQRIRLLGAINDDVDVLDRMLGQGELEVKSEDFVTVQYVGMLDDGSEFDSQDERTFMIGAREIPKGLSLGMMGMRIGGKRRIIVPIKLGFGSKGLKGKIPPNAVLHYEVMLRDIQRI